MSRKHFGHRNIFTATLLAFGVGAACFSGPSLAASYPERPITFVVGYAAGGATDILTRLIAKQMSEELEQPIIVENKAGANSNIGADYVARSNSDGYTIYINTIANTINAALYSDLTYDIIEDFEPIGLIASIANVLVVNPQSPYQNVEEYINYAKENPGAVSCASSGTGSSIHMSCELFKLKTGTDILHVPYRGSGPAVQDLLAGQVDSMFDNYPSSIAHINNQTLKPLATTTADRINEDIPTFKEAGVDDFLVSSWFGLAAPKGTSGEIIAALNKALNNSLDTSEIKEAFEARGFNHPSFDNTPENFSAYNQSEVDKWATVVKEANISVE